MHFKVTSMHSKSIDQSKLTKMESFSINVNLLQKKKLKCHKRKNKQTHLFIIDIEVDIKQIPKSKKKSQH